MDGFTFFKSYYQSAKHLNDEDQSKFYKCIMDYVFEDKEPEVSGHLMGFWLLVKPTLDKSMSRSKAGQTKSKQNQNKIKTDQKKDKRISSPPEDKDKDKELYKKYQKDPALNFDALMLWSKYKGSAYTKQGMTLSANKLKVHDHDIQMQMVEASIMNNWKGLFDPKKHELHKGGKTPQVGSLEWERLQSIKQDQEVIDATII